MQHLAHITDEYPNSSNCSTCSLSAPGKMWYAILLVAQFPTRLVSLKIASIPRSRLFENLKVTPLCPGGGRLLYVQSGALFQLGPAAPSIKYIYTAPPPE